jgi:hypothetical protein
MPLNISLQDPEYYISRIKNGCILDPSVFYSGTYVEATMLLVSSIKPKNVYLPSNLFQAYKEARWTSFLSTLMLWGGDYEKLPEAWYSGDALMEELEPTPIEVVEPQEELAAIFEAIAGKDAPSPLNKVLYEMTACSIQRSIPILVGSHSKFRLLELLGSKLRIVVVEPLAEWAGEKKKYLTAKKRRIAALALAIIGGAFIFITVPAITPLAGIGTGATITATIIDGS